MRTYRIKVVGCLILPFALQALDITIIASALPWIANDFHQIAQLNWIISALNLTSATFIPFWGQIADIFGRHASLQSALVIMLIGSALCTAAPEEAFPMLLVGRALQGMGCAGISVIVRVILADKVSLKENARNHTVFSLTAGLSYGIGPVIGGYLAQSHWRWCFGINLPICVVAIITVFFILRNELLGPQSLPQLDEQNTGRRERLLKRLTTIDAGGQLLFLFGFGLLVLAFTWAGATYDWNTIQVLVPLCVGAALVGTWLYYEYLMAPERVLGRWLYLQKPMIPWRLILNRNIGLLFYINCATGMAMYAVLYFASLYFTMVQRQQASQAGTQLLYYTPGLGVGVYIAMYMCNKWPRQTFLPLFFGSIVEAAGLGTLAWALWSEQSSIIYGMIALTGCGTGLRFMPGSLHAIGFFPKHIATVVSLMGIALPLGGTIALTIMTTVFNNTSHIARNSPLRNGEYSQLPEETRNSIIYNAKMGITWGFVSLTPFMFLCIIAAACLGNVHIEKDPSDNETVDEGLGHKVTHGSYLVSLFTGPREVSVHQIYDNRSQRSAQEVETLEQFLTSEPKQPPPPVQPAPEVAAGPDTVELGEFLVDSAR